MRFTRGTKVEIFSSKEIPIGEWLSAEILSGNGNNYTVKYSWLPVAVETVPRKVIRPVPPPREGKFSSGDVIEVFHDFSWKICQVTGVIDCNYFLVRVLGMNLEIKVDVPNLRIRQIFQDGEWLVLRSDCCGDSTRILKRRFDDESLCEFAKKRRVCEDIDKNDYDDKKKSCSLVGYSSESTVSGDSYSCRSSVGSCSLIGGNVFSITEHDDDCVSDAESSCGQGNEKKSHADEDLGAEHCKSGLVDYRYALREIFSSGPLSWEDEAKLMNLRERLRISDDEHLMVVRNLISANA